MAAPSEAGADLVTVCTDATAGGTLVRVVAPSRHIRMVDLMPVFEALDLNLVSYTAERDPDAVGTGANGGLQPPLGRRKHSFRGRFLVTDADGHNLSDAMLDGLVAALQDALHVRLSRPPRCSALHEDSRRGSVASYATDVSIEPDSPSFAAAVAHHAQGHFTGPGAQHGSVGHALSHLHPGNQHYSTHQQVAPHSHPAAQPYYSCPNPQSHSNPQQQQHPQQLTLHHEHTASAGSMLFSDLSASSIGSLLRAASGAASDHPTVPSPPAISRHDTISFTSLHQQHSDAALLDTPPSTSGVGGARGPPLGPGAGGVSGGGTCFVDMAPSASTAGGTGATVLAGGGAGGALDDRDRFGGGGGATTPFASGSTAAYPSLGPPSRPQTWSQLPSAAASDFLDLGSDVVAYRVSSACSTPPNVSGPLPLLPATTSPQPESDTMPPGAVPPPSPARMPTPGGAGSSIPAPAPPAVARIPHVSFYEPPAPACISASTSAVPTSATTPLHSRPPSASISFTPGSTGALLISANDGTPGVGHPSTNTCDAAAAAAAAASVDAPTLRIADGDAGGDGPGDGSSREGGGAVREEGSPTSSDEREGSYTWWSTFSAQDTVARIMSHPARSISADADLGQAKSLMTKHNISALLVNTGGPPGFITKRDFLKVQFSKNFKRTKVKDVMTQPVIFVDINLPIEQCSRVLEMRGVRRVLVHDPSRCSEEDPLSAFVGVVSDADLFKCMGAPAMSPVVGSMANSAEPPHGQMYGALPQHLPVTLSLPQLPALPSLPNATASQPLPGSMSFTQQHPTMPMAHSQPQLQPHPAQHVHPNPHQSPHPQQHLNPQALSSAASTASVSVSNSAGPSHAASYAGAVPVDSAAASAAAAAAAAAACSAASLLAMAGSGGSIVRLNAEASLADRYRCAAALWELDFNELEVTRRIGEGSFGEVLLASFRGTKVAVKRLRGFDVGPDNPDTGAPGETGPSPTQMPIFRQFFEREIEILATIRHPNVVNFIGACHTPPNVCLVTEYCARGSLDHLLHKSSITLDLLKKVEFSMDIARGMSCLHSQKPPIIHRDLKTANLLVSARFEVKVADFGLSRIKDHAQLINSRAGLEGTVEYAAPEVLRGEPFTEKCDIWSYAVLLWEIIHRQRPYADADVPIYILMMSLGNGTLRLPPVREDVASPGLARLVDRCMAWHPGDRPSFREVLHALEAEYKILRGKAAAVPRSDSASSMMVLPGTQNRPAGNSAADGSVGSGAASKPSAPHEQQPHSGAAAGVSAAGRPANPQAPHPALAGRKSSKLGINPHGNGPNGNGGADGGRAPSDSSAFASDASQQHHAVFWDPHSHDQHPQAHSQQQQQPPARPRVKLALPPQQQGSGANGGAGTADTPEPASPADSSSRPSSSRTGGAGSSRGPAGAGGGASKPGSAGRPAGRSIRSAARSKSMPLPEFEWFAVEDGFEDYMDTTDSVADEDGEAGASTATSTSGVTASGAAGAVGGAGGLDRAHPLDRGGLRSTPYPESTLLRSVDKDDADGVYDGSAEGGVGAAPAAADGLPHHLVVRVPRHGAAAESGPAGTAAGSTPGAATAAATATGRSQVSAFAAAAAMALPDGEEEDGDGAALAGSHWALGQRESQAVDAVLAPLRVIRAAAAAAAVGAAAGTDTSVGSSQGTTTATSAAASGVASTATAAAAAFRYSPFHMTANSPFANAADMPWSPRDSDETDGSLRSRLSSRIPVVASQANLAAAAAAQQQPQSPRQEPLPAVVLQAALTSLAGPQQSQPTQAAPRVTFFSPFSPFAQMAAEVPHDDSRCQEDGEEGADAEVSGQRQARGTGSGSGRGPTTAPVTANSTDVNTAAEKDQRAPAPEACWAMLGSCSKPPSGDVYSNGNGAASRVSPSARPPSPPTLAAVYAAAHRANTLAGVDILGTADVYPSGSDAAEALVAAAAGSPAEAVGMEQHSLQVGTGEGAQQPDHLHDLAHHKQQPHQMAAMAAAATAGLEALALMPDLAGAYGLQGVGVGVPGTVLESDQFADQFGDEDDEEDAALHTTAWVRL